MTTYPCHYCHRDYTHKSSLKRHVQDSHPGKLYAEIQAYDQTNYSSLIDNYRLRGELTELIKQYQTEADGSLSLDREKVKAALLLLLKESHLSSEHVEWHNFFVTNSKIYQPFYIYDGTKWKRQGSQQVMYDLMLRLLDEVGNLMVDRVVQMVYRAHIKSWLGNLHLVELSQDEDYRQRRRDYLDLVKSMYVEFKAYESVVRKSYEGNL